MKANYLSLAATILFPAITLAATPPPATLAELSWLAGSWEGDGIEGAPALESYAAAAGGQMVGHFRQLNKDGSVMFYEIVTIVEQGGSLTYRLKHFNPDLTGWEEKDKVVAFPLSQTGKGRWDFSGLVYERTGEDTMTASVVIHGEGGKEETLVFRFRRKGA